MVVTPVSVLRQMLQSMGLFGEMLVVCLCLSGSVEYGFPWL